MEEMVIQIIIIILLSDKIFFQKAFDGGNYTTD